jgi:predicted ATPase/class 3 adenylate cyclase
VSELPTGTVTFLFTDVEGSTRMLHELGDAYHELQTRHLEILVDASTAAGGRVVRTEGDAVFAVFTTPAAAARAAVAGQRRLATEPWSDGHAIRVRMGMHTGEGTLAGGDYIGLDVNLAARIAAAANGGQVVLSEATRALVVRSLSDGVAVRDLGQHALKDFDQPQHLFDLLIDGAPADPPPLRTTVARRRSNLPAVRTSFVGRERELADVARLLTETRLLTLTGPGGVGKTRLAVRAAADHLDRIDVHFVDLSGVRDASAVAPTIASSLGVRAVGAGPLDGLVHRLADRELLLVLDNFEQVTDAADVVDRLLHAAPGLRVLVTSRRPLRLSGEQEYQLGPLPPPDPAVTDLGALTASPAVRLFAARATAVLPGFAVTEDNAPAVAEIARRVDGLPLAIELAASRVKLMGPRELVTRMDRRLPLLTGGSRDLPERQRTLRAAIEWGHELLGPQERRLFERLSVFRSGWRLPAAETVCGVGLEIDVLDGLDSLVDRSLVRHNPASEGAVRFSMLETINEFATERLEASGEAPEFRRRHAEFIEQLTQEAEPRLRGEDHIRWLDRLEEEHDNIRAALDWAVEAADAQVALRIAAAMWRFWQLRGYVTEARGRLERILAMPEAQARSADRARALGALGGIVYWQNDYAAMVQPYEEAVSIAEELGDRRLLSRALYDCSFIPFVMRQDYEQEERLLRRALDVAEDDDLPLKADVLMGFGYIPWFQRGDWRAAAGPMEQALAMCVESGETLRIGEVMASLAAIRLLAGDVAEATRILHSAIELQMESRSPSVLGISMGTLAILEARTGDPVAAARLLGARDRLRDEGVGAPPPFALSLFGDPEAATRSTLGDEGFGRARADGYAMTFEQARKYTRELIERRPA